MQLEVREGGGKGLGTAGGTARSQRVQACWLSQTCPAEEMLRGCGHDVGDMRWRLRSPT